MQMRWLELLPITRPLPRLPEVTVRTGSTAREPVKLNLDFNMRSSNYEDGSVPKVLESERNQYLISDPLPYLRVQNFSDSMQMKWPLIPDDSDAGVADGKLSDVSTAERACTLDKYPSIVPEHVPEPEPEHAHTPVVPVLDLSKISCSKPLHQVQCQQQISQASELILESPGALKNVQCIAHVAGKVAVRQVAISKLQSITCTLNQCLIEEAVNVVTEIRKQASDMAWEMMNDLFLLDSLGNLNVPDRLMRKSLVHDLEDLIAKVEKVKDQLGSFQEVLEEKDLW